jgi:hypothetical protein
VKGHHVGPVGNGDDGALRRFHEREQALIQRFFGGFVERAGGLVGKNPCRLFQQYARDREALLLAA